MREKCSVQKKKKKISEYNHGLTSGIKSIQKSYRSNDKVK